MSTNHTLIAWIPVILLVFVGLISFLQRHFFRSDFLQSRWLSRKLGRFPSSAPLKGCLYLDFVLDLSVGEFLTCVLIFGWIFVRWGLFFNECPNWSAAAYLTNVRACFFRSVGEINFYTLGLIMFPVTRNSVWMHLLGISVERAIKFHRWLGRVAVIVMGIHGFGMWGSFALAKSDPATASFSYVLEMDINPATTWSNLSGFLCWCCFGAMTGMTLVRRWKFEWFYVSHLVLFPTGLVFGYLHMPALIRWIAPALSVYILDGFLRIWRTRYLTCETLSVEALPSGVTKVTVRKPKGFVYEPGQFAFVRIPSISMLQSHPFSISSYPGPNGMESFHFHIKDMGEGTFTHDLHVRAQQSQQLNTGVGSVSDAEAPSPSSQMASGNSSESLKLSGAENTQSYPDSSSVTAHKPSLSWEVMVDGPYGNPAIPVFTRSHNYKVLVLVCGGVGVTPCASLLGTFVRQHDNQTPSAPVVLKADLLVFIWSNPDASPLTWFKDVLAAARSSERVTLMLYATKAKDIVSVPGGVTVSTGRPDYATIFNDLQARHCGNLPTCGDEPTMAAFTCGPQPMVDAVQRAFHDCVHPVDFHKEIFLL